MRKENLQRHEKIRDARHSKQYGRTAERFLCLFLTENNGSLLTRSRSGTRSKLSSKTGKMDVIIRIV